MFFKYKLNDKVQRINKCFFKYIKQNDKGKRINKFFLILTKWKRGKEQIKFLKYEQNDKEEREKESCQP